MHKLQALMTKWPTPQDLMLADQTDLESCVKCLGFVKRRTRFILNLAQAAASNQDLLSQKGIGEYAKRSYAIFCKGQLGDTEPSDGPLKRYWRWCSLYDRGTRDRAV